MKAVTMDLHTHLLEKNVSPASYWKQALERKLDAVAITEHAEISPEKAFKKVWEKKPKACVLLPGAELFTDIGHVLVLADSEELYKEKKLFEKYVPLKKALHIARGSGWLLSIAHPWGFSQDSAAYIAGEKKLNKIVEKNGIGVEAYNGMIGNLSSLVYDTNWLKKPLNFFDFLEKSRVARKVKLDRIGTKMKSKIEYRVHDVIERNGKTLELGYKADFLTAGSDAHSCKRIGSGIIKLRMGSGRITPAGILKALQEKENVLWAGPYVKKVGEDRYVMLDDPVKKIELLQGMKYATHKVISREAGIAKIRKKLGRGKKREREAQ